MPRWRGKFLSMFYVKPRSDVSGLSVDWLPAGSYPFPESLFPEIREPGSTSTLSNTDPQAPEPGDTVGDAVPQGVTIWKGIRAPLSKI